MKLLLKTIFTSFLLIAFSNSSYSQRSKNGSFTATSANTIVNTYTSLSTDASIGNTSINVASATLNGAQFTSNLAAGDLIMIIQMQGASIDCDVTPTAVWGGNYTAPIGHLGDWPMFRELWGQVTALNNAGNFEKLEVLSVTGTTINVTCGLKNNYSVSGHTQIIRIPRFSNLIVNAGASIVPLVWNGIIGGVVNIEVEDTLTLNNSATPNIHANGLGFRPGLVDPTALTGVASSPNEVRFLGSNSPGEGSAKGEGIAGFTPEYNAIFSIYGIGSAANGGGGAGYQNCGGGGGSNVGNVATTFTGKGVPTTGYTGAWNLESAGMATSSSPGGGRGGYALSQSDQNELTVGPNNSSWGGDARKTNGGLGGHPLAYSTQKIFMGGGGGAGDQDSGQGGSGGAGGGIVFITVYGALNGTGNIQANGANGQKSNPGNTNPGFGQKRGNDGAGGAGGGGTVYIENISTIPATYNLTATGGVGGNHTLLIGVGGGSSEGSGPGGGGAGGLISTSTSSATTNISGGNNGVTNSSHLVNFPPNGATSGAVGINNQNTLLNNLTAINDTICGNSSASPSVTLVGTMPAGSTVYWYASQFSNTSINTGLTYNTPVLSSTTTYYVGICPGNFRIPVTVVVGAAPVISGTAIITNSTCNTAGSITGLSATGNAPLSYSWNGVSTPNANLNNATPNNYTLTITDNAGCTATSGPYTITGVGGPTIDASNITITNASCNGNFGSISGIIASGTGLSYSWTNTAQTTLNIAALLSGSYTLTVTDGNGCTASSGPHIVNFISGPSLDESNVLLQNENCNSGNGAITGLIAGGTALTYSWTNTVQNTLNLSSLSSGNYQLTVTDGNGCSITSSVFTINNIAGPSLAASNLNTGDENCGQADGFISGLTVNGGTAPYTFSWDNSAQNTLDIANLSANTYTLTLTDNLGCTVTSSPITISNAGGPSVDISNISISDETCIGNDGSISGITVNGVGLSYLWSNGANSLDISGLSPGNYSLVVVDANGCLANGGPFTINPAILMTLDTSSMTISPTGCANNTGSINGIVLNGGVNPTITWSNGESTLDINNLGAGNYILTIQDDQGCQIIENFQINLDNPPVIDASNMILFEEHCQLSDGTISGITVNGGTPGYQYYWNGSLLPSTIDLNNIPAGTYQLIVLDGQVCSDTLNLTVGLNDGVEINTNTISINDETCNMSNGSINNYLVNSDTTYTFTWNGVSSTSPFINNLSSGNYTLEITDAYGCQDTYIFVINDNAGPNADFDFSPNDSKPGEMVQFTDQTQDNVVFWQWIYNGDTVNTQDTEFVLFEGENLVSLIVVDANGCSDTVSKIITVFNEIEIPNVITANGDDNNDVFFIKGLKAETELRIFNRWGNVVFETNDYKNDWNGKDLSGENLVDGVYEYWLKESDDTVNHGFVHVVR